MLLMVTLSTRRAFRDQRQFMLCHLGNGPTEFGDKKMTAALLDRLPHHCEIIETGKEIWRFRNRT